MFRSSTDGGLQALLDKYSVLFKEELNWASSKESKSRFMWTQRPGHIKDKLVPYALRARVEELKRLEAAGITEPVTHSDRSTPVVPVVVKGDGSILLYGDYKLIVNRVASLEKYPLPRIEDPKEREGVY